MFRIAWVACIGLALFWIIGCGPSRVPLPKKVAVKGTVNMDSNPMADGEVVFVVPGLGPFNLPVKDGSFSGEAYVGSNKIEVFSYREGEPLTTGKKEATKINVIPDRFNSKSTLKAEVKDGDANEFRFDVTSKDQDQPLGGMPVPGM